MLGFRFVSLSQVLHPVINASGLSCHKYQGWRFGIPQAAMKTPSGFHGNCVLQDLETRCTRADLAPCKVIHLPSACCSPRITCIFLLSSAFQSVASPYREQVVAGSPHHTPRTSCCISSLPLFKNQTPNISTSMQACAHA